MRKKIIKDYYFFYFKRIYCYEPNYFKNFKYIKNNIPLYTFIESKYLRKPYPKQLIDPAIAALLPQDYNFKLNDYNSLDSTTKKDSFDSQFLKFNYPYYLNNKYNVKIVLNDYYCLLNKQLKIIKKYYFL